MRKAIMGLAALAVTIPALPTAAVAQGYYGGSSYQRDYRDGNYRRDRDYRRDQDRGRYNRYYDNRGQYSGPTWRGNNGRYHCRRADGTTGTLLGGAAGALLGRSIDTRGDRTTGTVLGAALGALLGNSIEKNESGRRCR